MKDKAKKNLEKYEILQLSLLRLRKIPNQDNFWMTPDKSRMRVVKLMNNLVLLEVNSQLLLKEQMILMVRKAFNSFLCVPLAPVRSLRCSIHNHLCHNHLRLGLL